MWQVFSRYLSRLENLLVGSLIIYAATALCTQIISRSLFDYSFVWIEESVRFGIIWMVFIGSSIGFREDAHIAIDVLQQILRPRARMVIKIVVIGVSAVVAGLLAWYGWQLVKTMHGFGQTSPAMEAPMYLFYLAIPLGGALMLVRLGESLVRVLRGQAANAPKHTLAG